MFFFQLGIDDDDDDDDGDDDDDDEDRKYVLSVRLNIIPICIEHTLRI